MSHNTATTTSPNTNTAMPEVNNLAETQSLNSSGRSADSSSPKVSANRKVQQHQPYLPRPAGGDVDSSPKQQPVEPPTSSQSHAPTMDGRNHHLDLPTHHHQQQYHQQQPQHYEHQYLQHQQVQLNQPQHHHHRRQQAPAVPEPALTYYHHAYWQMQQQQQQYYQQQQQYAFGGQDQQYQQQQQVMAGPSHQVAPVSSIDTAYNTIQSQQEDNIIAAGNPQQTQQPNAASFVGYDNLPEYRPAMNTQHSSSSSRKSRTQNQQHRKISSSSSENTSNPPSSARSPVSSMSKRELRQAQQQLPFPDCCHHRALVEKMEFVLPPSDLHSDAGNLPANSHPEQFYRLFLGQCRFETKAAELRWLLHYLGNVQPIKVEQRGRGAFMAFLKTEAELQTLLQVLSGRMLFDYTGVWFARSEEQATLLRSYIDKYSSHSTPNEQRAARLPKDLVVLRDQQEAEELQALGPVQPPLHWVPPRSDFIEGDN